MELAAFLAEDRGPSIIITASIFIVLSTLFVGLRYYARYLMRTPFGVQDVIVPFAWLAEVGLCVDGIMMVKYAHTGRHLAYIVTVDPERILEHFKGILIIEATYPAAVAFPKLLVVLMYLHILTNRYERMAAKVLAGIILATWISYTIATVFQCSPIAFSWNKTLPMGRCFNIRAYLNSSSAPNIFTDLVVLLLPLRTVWGLKISTGRRVGLLMIFLMGGIGIVASIIRTVVFARTLGESGPLTDSTYDHVTLINWTIIEPGIYLLSGCALSFKPLFRIFVKALRLQVFLTHTKTTFQSGKSKNHTTAVTYADIHLKSIPYTGGKFYLLSEDSDKGGEIGKMEVLVTRTVDIETENGRFDGRRKEEFERSTPSAV